MTDLGFFLSCYFDSRKWLKSSSSLSPNLRFQVLCEAMKLKKKALQNLDKKVFDAFKREKNQVVGDDLRRAMTCSKDKKFLSRWWFPMKGEALKTVDVWASKVTRFYLDDLRIFSGFLHITSANSKKSNVSLHHMIISSFISIWYSMTFVWKVGNEANKIAK